MKILADLHHSDLYYSLQLLFEKRLDAELFRPIGLEWYEQGYWHVYPHINTARQYLATDQAQWAPRDVHGNELPPSAVLNKNYRYEDGIYYISDPTKKGIVNRGITLEKFKSMEFDILISSIPPHIGPFNSLIAQFQPRAKHIFQVGNAWGHQPGVRNILASTSPFPVPAGTNVCFYHQEFDLDVFYYAPPTVRNRVTSYIHYMKGKEMMNRCASALPGWEFRSFGAGMEDGIMETHLIADSMRNSAFIWHNKPEGDGFGYSIFEAFAVGRPPVVNGGQYQGKLASRLFSHMSTCIDVNQLRGQSLPQILLAIAGNPSWHNQMCEAATNQFKKFVNYDADELRIREFLGRLQ